MRPVIAWASLAIILFAPVVRAQQTPEAVEANARAAAVEPQEREGKTSVDPPDPDCGADKKRACFPKNALALRADTTSLFAFSQIVVSGKAPHSAPVNLGIGPGARYFVAENFALGAELYVYYRDNEDLKTSGYSLRGTAGPNVPIGRSFSFWPEAGLGLTSARVQRNGELGYNVELLDALLNAIFLYAPAPHFFAGLGPQATFPVSASSPQGEPRKTIGLGGSLILGGWL